MNTYEAADWLLHRGVRTSRGSLDRINFILDELGNPQRNYASVIIGGTNGKGSVTAIIESIMKNCPDYVSGSLTSPHLVDIKERIKLMGKPLPDQYWIDGVKELQEVSKILDKDASIGSAGFFEAVTALAFWAFREAEIDLAILEVGLGGRFDSTNSAEPEISVITNIGTDHQEYLGTDKISIAHEKLGIIRKKRPLITTEKSPEILAEFEKECKEKRAVLIKADGSKYFTVVESRADGHLLKTVYSEENIFFPLPGEHQLENLAAALEVITQLRINGFQISDEAVVEGLQTARWPGRLQWIKGEVPILLDGAHNAEGYETLDKYLHDFPPAQPLNIIFGGLKDKPVEKIAEGLKKYGAKLCFVAPDSPRAITREDFDKKIAPFGWKWFDTLSQAYEECKQDAETILITGSLYLIAEALKKYGK